MPTWEKKRKKKPETISSTHTDHIVGEGEVGSNRDMGHDKECHYRWTITRSPQNRSHNTNNHIMSWLEKREIDEDNNVGEFIFNIAT